MWHLVETAAGLRVGRKPAGKVRSRLRTPLCDRARKSCESHGGATLTLGKHEERKPASKASPAVRKVREIAALRCACCPRSKQGCPYTGRSNTLRGRAFSRLCCANRERSRAKRREVRRLRFAACAVDAGSTARQLAAKRKKSPARVGETLAKLKAFSS
ncbi:hypothetical protein MRX96_022522 [Rhipicephalus microplus]